ncbi:N-acetylmuramate alpha-1-phosphate uridylyltransferase MurU [Pseudohaliea rubra]|uniref:Glucose-1-phosphate thymidylyltransferase n=1 Tax=Pseudohaliea rubra DSM 19751 TaxID=1265313 RepID=A0A095VP07_9GAMM|nr:nucleotidyltransferase family protein [Pseudohaliea rubra]KGE02858.1 Glucose-1-phosphate thymidylyltransferase [Pseudohaliea rubra DSM 19751]
MVLAAGRGERMRPLTLKTPKPLLAVGGKPLLAHHLERLAAGGIREVVINLSWLGEQIEAYCGDGGAWGLSLLYSREPEPLETAGGIVQALPLLGDAPFLVVNGDVFMDYDVPALAARAADLVPAGAHLLLAENPDHHPGGDFALRGERVAGPAPGEATVTFTGTALYHPAFFAGLAPGARPLRPLFEAAMAAGRLSGERHGGRWVDVGTPERLAALDASLREEAARG